jgi:hypothetical protein
MPLLLQVSEWYVLGTDYKCQRCVLIISVTKPGGVYICVCVVLCSITIYMVPILVRYLARDKRMNDNIPYFVRCLT